MTSPIKSIDIVVGSPELRSYTVSHSIQGPIDLPFDGVIPPPRTVPGLMLWLRADMGVTLSFVTQWDDQSGAGDSSRNFIQGQNAPTLIDDAALGGRPALRFDAAFAQTMAMVGLWDTAPINQPYTMMLVGRTASPGLPHNVYIGSDTRNQWYMCAFWDNNTSAPPPFFGSDAGTGVGTNLQSIVSDVGQSVVWITEVNDPTSTVRINDQAANYQQLGGTPFNTDLGVLDVLRLAGAFGTGLAGDVVIAEVVIFDRVLTSAELASLNTYAGDRYSITIAGPRGDTIADPRDIGTPLLWLRADKGIHARVGTWEDQSGVRDPNRDFAQPDTSDPPKRPLYVTADSALGNRPAIHFDGAFTFLDQVGAWPTGTAPPLTMIVVGYDSDSATQNFIGEMAANNWYVTAYSGHYASSIGSDTLVGTSPDSTTPKILYFEYNGADSTIRVNAATPEKTGTMSGADLPQLELGGNTQGQAPLNGAIAEVLMYGSILSDHDRTTILAYLGGRYGITVGP